MRRGIEFGLAADWDAAVVLLGDMPFVTPETVDKLVAAYRGDAGPIIAPRYDGKRGNPVLLDQSQFEPLRQVTGDCGGRELVRSNPDTAWVDVEDPGVRRDVDTVDDLR